MTSILYLIKFLLHLSQFIYLNNMRIFSTQTIGRKTCLVICASKKNLLLFTNITLIIENNPVSVNRISTGENSGNVGIGNGSYYMLKSFCQPFYRFPSKIFSKHH